MESAMQRESHAGLSRRKAVALGAATLAATGLARSSRVSASHAITSGGGIVGGGLLKLEDGEANVALAGLIFEDGVTHPGMMSISVFGRLLWVVRGQDGTTLTLEGTEITGYEYLTDVTNGEGREFSGYLQVDGSGRHPFTVKIHDLGMPGSALDTISLEVAEDISGAGDVRAGFTYSASGTLASGGFETLHVGEGSTYGDRH